MKTPRIDSNDLKKFFKQTKIATLGELKKVLGTEVAVTVFRKLKEQGYRSSYSHRGAYYTLDRNSTTKGFGRINQFGFQETVIYWRRLKVLLIVRLQVTMLRSWKVLCMCSSTKHC